jgi:hypothetical protein
MTDDSIETVDRKALQPHQQRVIEEEKALSEKLNKLGEFIHGSIFAGLSTEDRMLLQEQDDHMRVYVHVLRKRIDRFTRET